jgi:thioredoxin-like negative regulator of GroEL
MSNSQPSSTKFWILAATILVASATSLAALWPVARTTARAESAKLVREGDQASGSEAATDYLLATKLDATNHRAYARLADSQIASGQPEDALASLKRAGEGSDVEQLQVRTLIELGRTTDAANEAAVLTDPDRTDSDLTLAALAFAAAGRNADATALIPRVKSPETGQHIKRSAGSSITLASELYAAGLLKSSSAILVKLPPSYERNFLLARIRYTQHSTSSLAEATDLLAEAVSTNPSSLEGRELLAKVLYEQNRPVEAAAQDTLAAKLRAGRP